MLFAVQQLTLYCNYNTIHLSLLHKSYSHGAMAVVTIELEVSYSTPTQLLGYRWVSPGGSIASNSTIGNWTQLQLAFIKST